MVRFQHCGREPGSGLLFAMSESATEIKLFFRSTIAPHCHCGYTTGDRSGG